jgi:long-subunit fatty acid transport protein
MYWRFLQRGLKRPFIVASLSCLLVYLHTAQAGSFALNEQSVSGLGVAYAGGAARASDASTIFFNPAGIALLDQGELQLGGHFVAPQAHFSNEGSRYKLPNTPFNNLPLSGGNDGDGGVAHLLPNIYFSQPIFRSAQYGDLALGIGHTGILEGRRADILPGGTGWYQLSIRHLA